MARIRVNLSCDFEATVNEITTIDEDKYFEWLGDAEHSEDSLAEYLEDYDFDYTFNMDVTYYRDFEAKLLDPIRDRSAEIQLHQEESLF